MKMKKAWCALYNAMGIINNIFKIFNHILEIDIFRNSSFLFLAGDMGPEGIFFRVLVVQMMPWCPAKTMAYGFKVFYCMILILILFGLVRCVLHSIWHTKKKKKSSHLDSLGTDHHLWELGHAVGQDAEYEPGGVVDGQECERLRCRDIVARHGVANQSEDGRQDRDDRDDPKRHALHQT